MWVDRSAIALRLARQVADSYGYDLGDLLGTPRHQRIAEARHVLCYLGRLHGMSSVEIGHQLGRDHTTVLNSWGVVARSTRLLRVCCQMAAEYVGATPVASLPGQPGHSEHGCVVTTTARANDVPRGER